MKTLMLAIPFVFFSQGLCGQGFWGDLSIRRITPLTYESWQEYKADTLARRHIERHIERRSASLVLDSLKPGFHWTSSCVGVDTVWATRPPTFEGWMSWLEQRKASED